MDDGSGGHQQYHGFFDGLQGMGILNALRTGDARVDMVMALLFPFIVKQCLEWLQLAKNWIVWYYLNNWNGSKPHEERTIQHLAHKDRYGSSYSNDDTQNTILLKAIQLYLHAKIQLKLPLAEVDLTSTEDKNSNVSNQQRSYHYYDSDNENDDDEGKTLVGALSKYRIVQKPPPGRWHDLGEYGGGGAGGGAGAVGDIGGDGTPTSKTKKLDEGDNDKKNQDDSQNNSKTNSYRCMVKLRIEKDEHEQGQDGSSGTKIITCFRFQAAHGQAIDDFIQQAYDWYISELRKMEDHARYLYELKANGESASSGKNNNDDDGGGGGGSGGRAYTRYRLSDEKTFESLFFSQKEGLLKILDHFQERSGKYAIKGYPHKLGLLLHGPPGSGKTSLIKALAHYTNRSIINVPLARVHTNSELMAIFNSERKYVDGESVPVKLGFKDVIFVMEDVDAASNIVKRRDGKMTADMIRIDELDMPLPKPLWHMFLESSDPSCQELVQTLKEKSERLTEEATCPDLIKKITQKIVSVPGLSVIGEAGEDPSLQKISNEAINTTCQIMEDQGKIDEFLGKQASIINNLLSQGAEVDEELVDDLLGCRPFLAMVPAKLSREISYTTSAPDGVNPHVELMSNQVLQGQIGQQLQGGANGDSSKHNDKNKSYKKGVGETDTVALGPMNAWAAKFNIDELNLSGLLNVLDGVVDSPGRILIMTTNHVEQLDPALIRPGRIDKKLLLGYMAPRDIVEMIQHYFRTTLDNVQKDRINIAITGDGDRPQLKLTPAQIEQMTAEHDEVEEMITALEVKGGSQFSPAYRVSAAGQPKLSKSMIAFDV